MTETVAFDQVDDTSSAKLWQQDDESLPVPSLFAVESYQGKEEGWVLETRMDERGWGSPLIWTSQEAAETWVREIQQANGCHGDQRVVVFFLAYRLVPPDRCEMCGREGHLEEQCPYQRPSFSDTAVLGSSERAHDPKCLCFSPAHEPQRAMTPENLAAYELQRLEYTETHGLLSPAARTRLELLRAVA